MLHLCVCIVYKTAIHLTVCSKKFGRLISLIVGWQTVTRTEWSVASWKAKAVQQDRQLCTVWRWSLCQCDIRTAEDTDRRRDRQCTGVDLLGGAMCPLWQNHFSLGGHQWCHTATYSHLWYSAVRGGSICALRWWHYSLSRQSYGRLRR